MMILPISADNVALLLHCHDAFMQRTMLCIGYALWLCESSVCIAMERLRRELHYAIIKHSYFKE